ncbi:radical SAM protein [Candidatus Woesearchaeota archaeon]|nr:radical SAM protein [Candidatus Woesearchaeota archaeon]
MKKVYIETNGCAVIRHDTQRYSKFFRLNGWKEIDSAGDADLIIMTTCGVIESNEQFALDSIVRIKSEMKTGAQLVVGGCIPKINPEKINDIFNGIIFSAREEDILNRLIDAKIKIDDIYFDGNIFREHSFGDPRIVYSEKELDQLAAVQKLSQKFKDPEFIEIYDYLTAGRHFWKEKDLFEVKVAEGCSYSCSYCGTKRARGNLKSRDPEQILNEFKFGAKNYPKILLIGDEVGEYGIDIGSSLVDLLDKLMPVAPSSRIALRYVSPNSLLRQFNALESYFETGQIYFICSAFQSGSPKILELMNRTPNIDAFVSKIKEMELKFPFVYKHTQIIVGFPQETEEDFQCTLDLLRACQFDYVTVSRYSDRPHTKSSKLEGKIAPEIINNRYEKARKVVEDIREKRFWSKINKKLVKNVKNTQ